MSVFNTSGSTGIRGIHRHSLKDGDGYEASVAYLLDNHISKKNQGFPYNDLSLPYNKRASPLTKWQNARNSHKSYVYGK